MSSPSDTREVSPVTRTVPLLLTIRETSELLNVSQRTLERWSLEGRLPRVELGPKTIRYRADDLAAMIEPRNDDDPGANRAEVTTEDTRAVQSSA